MSWISEQGGHAGEVTTWSRPPGAGGAAAAEAGEEEGAGSKSEWGGWGGGALDQYSLKAGRAEEEGEAGEDGSPPTPQEKEMMAMGVERGMAMVALAKYGNKVEAAVNYVFDQLADPTLEETLKGDIG